MTQGAPSLERCNGCGRQATTWHRATGVCRGVRPEDMSPEHAEWVAVAREALHRDREPNAMTAHWHATARAEVVTYRRAELTRRMRLDQWEREQATRAPRPVRQLPGRGLGRPAGVVYPRCPECSRSITGPVHRCKPLKRSHRHADVTDALTTTPRPLQGSLPWPAEGVIVSDVRIVNPSNASYETWRKRSERSKAQRAAVARALRPYCLPSYPVAIEFCWLHSVEADDDAIPASMKHVRDQVAEAYGIDDRDRLRLRFSYSQEQLRELDEIRVRGVVRRQFKSVVRIRLTSLRVVYADLAAEEEARAAWYESHDAEQEPFPNDIGPPEPKAPRRARA